MLERPLRPVALLLLACLLLSLAISAPPLEAVEPEDIEIKMSLAQDVERLWTEMPTDAGSPSVSLTPPTQPDCANAALRKAKAAISEGSIGPAAWKALKLTIKLGKEFLKAFGVGYVGDAADLFTKYLESESPEDFAKKVGEWATGKAAEKALKSGANAAGGAAGKGELGDAIKGVGEQYVIKKGASEAAKALYKRLTESVKDRLELHWDDPACGRIDVTFELAPGRSGDEPGFYLYFSAQGDCSCKWPESVPQPMKLGRWRVIGHGQLRLLSRAAKGKTLVATWGIKDVAYEVLASCGCSREQGEGGMTEGPGQGETVPSEPPPGQNKENTDYRNIERRCDPTGRLRELIRWNERRLAELYEKKADAKRVAWRKSELDRAQKQLCDCLRAMKGDPSLAGDAGLQKQLDEFIKSYCSPPEEPKTTPPSGPPAIPPPPAGPCDDAREAYEQARERYLAGGGNNPGLELSMVEKRKGYCRCLEKKYSGKLPPDLKAFCDPRQSKIPSPPPAETLPPPATTRTTPTLIGVVFPADTRPGEKFTATVVTDPDAYKSAPALRVVEFQLPLERGADGKPVLHGVTVDLGDGRAQPADGPITCDVGKSATRIRVSVGRPSSGTPAAERDVPVDQISAGSQPPTDFQAPPTCSEGVNVVRGPFGGDAGSTRLTVNDRPARIVAETPRAVWWQPPAETPPGPAKLVCQEGTRKATIPIAVLRLVMSADRLKLLRGESTGFRAAIEGLGALPESAWRGGPSPELLDTSKLADLAPGVRVPGPNEPGVVVLILQNTTRDVISIAGSQNEVIVRTIDRGSVPASGTYEYRGVIQSKKSGGFGVSGTVLPLLAPVRTGGP